MVNIPKKQNTVTVVIPTCNAGPKFKKLLCALAEQDTNPTEIIVIDSQSNDSTVDVAKSRNCRVIQIERSNFDHGTTRNLAVSLSKTEFVVLLTQDAIPADENMISELIKPLENDPNIAISYGRQLPLPGTDPIERFNRKFNYPPDSLMKTKDCVESLGLRTFFCSNSCSAIRRSIFRRIGGFKNGVLVNEDMLYAGVAICMGYAVYYAADAKVFHSHKRDLHSTASRYVNIGRFFAENRWLLQIAPLSSYGGPILKTGIRNLIQEHTPLQIFNFLTELVVKATAYKLGWYSQILFHERS